MRSNKLILFTTVVAALFFVQAAMALPQTIQFAAVPGASILFVGSGTDSTFSFPPNGVGQSDFRITAQSSGSSLINLLGEITGSFNFTAASVTTIGPVETAPVASLGTTQFIIHADQDFTANLAWNDIRTVGQGGFVNTMAGDLNLTNFSYGGSNADLLDLLSQGSATVTANFQFIPARDLLGLASTACSGSSNPCSTSFSGSLSAAVPEASFTSFLVIGLFALFALIRRRRATAA